MKHNYTGKHAYTNQQLVLTLDFNYVRSYLELQQIVSTNNLGLMDRVYPVNAKKLELWYDMIILVTGLTID